MAKTNSGSASKFIEKRKTKVQLNNAKVLSGRISNYRYLLLMGINEFPKNGGI